MGRLDSGCRPAGPRSLCSEVQSHRFLRANHGFEERVRPRNALVYDLVCRVVAAVRQPIEEAVGFQSRVGKFLHQFTAIDNELAGLASQFNEFLGRDRGKSSFERTLEGVRRLAAARFELDLASIRLTLDGLCPLPSVGPSALIIALTATASLSGQVKLS